MPIDTGLKGINNESIIFECTDSIADNILFILSNIEKVSYIKEQILIEGLYSSTIEGANTTVEQVSKVLRNPVSKSDKMVVNNFKALHYVYEHGISLSNIRTVWEIITKDVCENLSCDGILFRSKMVYVGKHTPEKPEKIHIKMKSLFEDCINTDPIIKACIYHWYTAYIHPFCDGNGRLARLCLCEQLNRISIDFNKISISRAINNRLMDYYKSFPVPVNNVIDITTSIEYMIDRISAAVKFGLRGELTNTLDYIYNKMLKSNDGFTVSKLSKVLNISSENAHYYLQLLFEKGYASVEVVDSNYVYKPIR